MDSFDDLLASHRRQASASFHDSTYDDDTSENPFADLPTGSSTYGTTSYYGASEVERSGFESDSKPSSPAVSRQNTGAFSPGAPRSPEVRKERSLEREDQLASPTVNGRPSVSRSPTVRSIPASLNDDDRSQGTPGYDRVLVSPFDSASARGIRLPEEEDDSSSLPDGTNGRTELAAADEDAADRSNSTDTITRSEDGPSTQQNGLSGRVAEAGSSLPPTPGLSAGGTLWQAEISSPGTTNDGAGAAFGGSRPPVLSLDDDEAALGTRPFADDDEGLARNGLTSSTISTSEPPVVQQDNFASADRDDSRQELGAHPISSSSNVGPSTSFDTASQSFPIIDASKLPMFVITVGDPHKIGADLGGGVGGAHIVYTVRTRTTSSAFRKSEFSVLRRYSDFVWLFDALTSNNPGVVVPPIPEKNALGRFSHDFVEQRRAALQTALQRMCNHPMLNTDADLRTFLESDSFSLEIKHRRLDTEKSGLFGSWGNSLAGPRFNEFDEFFANRRSYIDSFESSLKALHTTLTATSKSRAHLSSCVGELSQSILTYSTCETILSPALKNAVIALAGLEKRLRDKDEEQAQQEDQGLAVTVEGYIRLVASIKITFAARIKAYHTWQSAEEKVRKARVNHEKGKRQGRDLMGHTLAEITDTERRCDDARRDFEDISKVIRAEMIRFDRERVDDFRGAIESYVDVMLDRQREVVQAWEDYYVILQRIGAPPRPPPAEQGQGGQTQAQAQAPSQPSGQAQTTPRP